MSKDPAVLFYTSDFLSGTQFFSDEQCGQYIRLLCQQHQLGHIPEQHMLNICKTYDNPVFSKFIKDKEGLFFNERMDQEKSKRIAYSESRRKNISFRYKHTHEATYVKPMKVHMENENENDNDNINGNKDRVVRERKPHSNHEVAKLIHETAKKIRKGDIPWVD